MVVAGYKTGYVNAGLGLSVAPALAMADVRAAGKFSLALLYSADGDMEFGKWTDAQERGLIAGNTDYRRGLHFAPCLAKTL